MAGIKISNLPANSTLIGHEQIAIVQCNITKVAELSSVTGLVGSSYLPNTQFAATSGVWTTVNSSSATWSGVYSDWKSLSSSLVNKNCCNTFCQTQSFPKIIAVTIEAGCAANVCGCSSSVLGGYYNDVTGGGSAVVAGNNNDVNGNFSTIAAGQNNLITATGINGFIANGQSNCVRHCNAVAMGTCTISVSSNMLHVNRLYASDIPTSNPGVAGVLWNDSGTLKVSTNI